PEWKPERELAHGLLQQQAMWWEPAWVWTAHLCAAEELIPIYYRIHIDRVTGRRAEPDPSDPTVPINAASPATISAGQSWLRRLLHR
ncbi:MAG: hypothetical protein ACKV2V_09825, partial [Blastocatellia bacterium]